MRKIHREIERFEARSDDGDGYVVIVLQEYQDTSNLSGSGETPAGAPFYTLRDGSPLTKIDDDTFSILQTGQILHRVK